MSSSATLTRSSSMPSLTRRRSHTPPSSDIPPTNPTELLVLSHGLQGTHEDFPYLIEELRKSPAGAEDRVLVHPSPANTHKTHDGVVYGGLRLVEDIRKVVADHKSLRRISMMGFSLGGLYIRYAAGVLYDKQNGTIAGLEAGTMFVVATPNLGVRSFGVYRFLPNPMLPMANAVFGETAKQMLLQDDDQVLVAMTSDNNKQGIPFLSALAAFQGRILYANVRKDFMVNYGTAALDHEVRELSGPDVEHVINQGVHVDVDYDDKGCRVCFELEYEKEELETEGEEKGADDRESEEDEVEQAMGRRLKALGWKVVGVDFPISVPIAHNRIVAVSRNAVHAWLNAGGRRVVRHLVDSFLSETEGEAKHEPRFQPVTERVEHAFHKHGSNGFNLFNSH